MVNRWFDVFRTERRRPVEVGIRLYCNYLVVFAVFALATEFVFFLL